MFHIVRRVKQNGGGTSVFDCPGTERERLEDADTLAEVMAMEHAINILTDAPTSPSAGVYKLITSNGSVVEYVVKPLKKKDSGDQKGRNAS